MFLETLVDFVVLHRDDLQDWLFVLLTQLLKKMGADLLGSVQAKVQKALDVTRLPVPQADVMFVWCLTLSPVLPPLQRILPV